MIFIIIGLGILRPTLILIVTLIRSPLFKVIVRFKIAIYNCFPFFDVPTLLSI